MITKTFKLTIATDTEEEMQEEKDYLSMIYGAEEIEKDKTGKWIYRTIRGEKRPCCSECGEETGTIYEYRFCPNCGIEMTEDKK